MTLENKNILITGAARRIGRSLALSLAQAGAGLIIHYGGSQTEAESLQAEILALGSPAHLLQADLNDADQVAQLIPRALECLPPGATLFGLINNASIFEALDWNQTDLPAWERHLRINLTAPFLLSQAFARALPQDAQGRIINLLDWRALRPGADHFPYTISKAALAALTRSLAQALAPRITVNGLALGAILPPSDGLDTQGILKFVPAKRWAELDEVTQTMIFLLDGPAYISGEIIHLDGGRHLV
jgi:NAD(P)-dependent dehydrogenase (short-subunit alcohol dehydrogenase family)